MPIPALDAVDLKILRLLQDDGRMSLADLADKVGLSASPCLRRVRILEKSGVIARYVAVLDQRAVGLPVSVFVSVKLEKQREELLERFAKTIARWPEVLECYLMTGPRDYWLRVVVPDLAAYERFQEACVVVDFGTGINIDAVSAEGEYLGGAIGPGLEISLTALIDRAARITRIDLGEPEAAIGRSSRAAIQSGFVFGFAGMIDGLVRRIELELSEPRLLATGGLASVVVPFSETIDEVDDMLTLNGLRLIHERNARAAD